MKSFLFRKICICRRGSVLAVVLIFCILLALAAERMMNLTLHTSKSNMDSILLQESRLAAEGAGEYVAGRVASIFDQRLYVPADELRNTNTTNPLVLPPNFSANWTGTKVIPTSIEVHAGMIGNVYTSSVPNDAAHSADPFRGRSYKGRNIDIYATATAKDPGLNREVTARIMQRIEVRDAPVFTNAIFYNMDMELSPTSTFDVTGPVTVNGDAYFDNGRPSTGSLKDSLTVNFYDSVSISGKLIQGSYKSASDETLNTRTNAGLINMISNSGLKPLLKSTTSDGSSLSYATATDAQIKDYTNWFDSRNEGDAALITSTYDGFLKTGASGARKSSVTGFKDYVPDDPSTGASELQNNPYALIEPAMPKSGSGSANHKGELESQKMAYKASLIFKLEKNLAFNSSEPVSQSNNPFKVKAYKPDRENPEDPQSAPKLDSAGKPKLLEVALPNDLIGKANSSFTGVSNSNDTIAPELYYEEGPGHVKGGMYDPRQEVALNMTTLDVGKLKNLIENNNQFNDTFNPAKDWNGVVYFETPTSTTVNSDGSYAHADSTRSDKIAVSALSNQAIQLVNAGSVPNVSNETNSSFASQNKGFAFATNAPLYTIGNVNANGSFTAGDGSEVIPETNEAPVALYADSVTALSGNWANNRALSRNPDSSARAEGRVATNTEISAAIVTGITPTVLGDDKVSGGANQAIRFLEDWTGKTLVMRTSIVGMFKSEVQPNAIDLSDSRHWFSAPNRRYGFNQLFGRGEFAPGSPNVRQVIRRVYRDLSLEEYNSGVTAVESNLRPSFK